MSQEKDVQLVQAVTAPGRMKVESAPQRLVVAVRSEGLRRMSPMDYGTHYVELGEGSDPVETVAKALSRFGATEVVTRLPDDEPGRALTEVIRERLPAHVTHQDLPLKYFKSWEHALAAQSGIRPETVDAASAIRTVPRTEYITEVVVTDERLDGLAYQQLHPETAKGNTLYIHVGRIGRVPALIDATDCLDAVRAELRGVQHNNLAVSYPHPETEPGHIPDVRLVCAFENSERGRERYEHIRRDEDLWYQSVDQKNIRRDSPTLEESWSDVVRKQERAFILETSKMLEANGIQLERAGLWLESPESSSHIVGVQSATEKVQPMKEEISNQQRAVDSDIAGRLFGQFGIHTETLQAPQFQKTFTTIEGFEYDWLPVRGYDEVRFPRRGMDADAGSNGSYESYPIDLHENDFERIDDQGYAAKSSCYPGKPSPEYVNGMWSSNREPGVEVRRVVVVPRAVDAMAHYQLAPDPHSVYLSLGNIRGGMDWTQKEILQNELKSLPGNGGELVLAAGRRQVSDLLIQDLENRCLPTVTFKIESPDSDLSWTDKLQRQERDWIRAQGLEPMEVGEEWRGTITEAISEAGKRPGVVGFVNADWASHARLRVETSQQLAESIEKVRTLIAPESEARRVYTIGGDGTIRNTVTDREEFVAVSAEALKARPELGAALEKQAAMGVGTGAREPAVEAPDMDIG